MRERFLNHPENEPLIIIRQWQLAALDGNQCAAALLSFLEYWHGVKLANARQDKNPTLLQWHTQKELEAGILHLYKRDTIRKAINLLEQKGFISTHDNPVEHYKIDRTRHFLFEESKVRSFLNAYLYGNIEVFSNDEKSLTNDEKSATPFPEYMSEKSLTTCEKSSQQRLHAETTLGDYLVPSLISKARLDSPLERKFAPLANQSISDLTPGVAIEHQGEASVPIENTSFFSVRDCADNHAAQGGLFAPELPQIDPMTTLGYRDTFSGDSVQPCPVSAKKRAISESSFGKKSAKTETDPRSAHPAIQAVRELVEKYPKKILYDGIIEILGDSPDIERLKSCYREAVKRGCNGNSWYWVDWYRDGIPEFVNGKSKRKQGLESKYGTFDFDKYKPKKSEAF